MDSHIATLKELTALGKELGYKDADLNKWVGGQMRSAEEKAQADMDREERRMAREDPNKKEELQAQIEMKKMELPAI